MLVRRRGSGKCLQEQLVWRVWLMQFLCLNSLDRKDQGFRKMHKKTRMEFEETRTHTHGFIKCSWFTSLEPLYQFFVPYQTMWLWLVFPSSYFGVRVCVLIISSCQATSTNFNNQLWQPNLQAPIPKVRVSFHDTVDEIDFDPGIAGPESTNNGSSPGEDGGWIDPKEILHSKQWKKPRFARWSNGSKLHQVLPICESFCGLKRKTQKFLEGFGIWNDIYI